METKYDVFISYSRKDYIDENTKVVIPDNPISKIMEAFDDAGITYWIDKKGIYHGDEFSGVIADAIEASSVFVFVSSEYSNNSPWTTGEIATAQEAKKKIIPVRIDFSRYHKSLRVRLNALDYIDFTSNLEENTQSLIVAIKAYLTQIKEEEERKKEEERRKRELELQKAEEAKRKQEEETKRKQEEQQKLIDEIRRDCTALNIKETQLELDRQDLLIRAETVTSQEQRNELKSFIESSSPIAKKYEEQLSTADKQIAHERSQKDLLSKDLTRIERELEAAKKQANQSPEKTTVKPNTKKLQILLATSLLLGLILGFISTSFIHSAFSSDKELVSDTLVSTQPITPTENIEPPQPKKVVKEVIVSPQLNSYTYTGWVNSDGVPDGEGEAVFANGDTFVGTFSNGELKKGKYTWVEDESYFEGSFMNNEPHEQDGAYYDKNGEQR